MKKIILVLFPLIAFSSESDLQSILAERTQLESISAGIQSEIKVSSGERDRLNEKILNLEDELKDLKRKMIEAKEKKAHFLAKVTDKSTKAHPPIDLKQMIASIESYGNFISNGIPWDVDARAEKLKSIKTAALNNQLPSNESVIQWSQFLESERKLASETQKRIRRFSIDNKETDASIFRLGLTALYYKTADNQTGLFYRKNQRLFHQVISDEKSKNRIIQLVETQDDKSGNQLLSELVLTQGMIN